MSSIVINDLVGKRGPAAAEILKKSGILYDRWHLTKWQSHEKVAFGCMAFGALLAAGVGTLVYMASQGGPPVFVLPVGGGGFIFLTGLFSISTSLYKKLRFRCTTLNEASAKQLVARIQGHYKNENEAYDRMLQRLGEEKAQIDAHKQKNSNLLGLLPQ